MFKSILSKLTQGILIIAMIYAGSFVFIEESSEKTEKTEKSEEALHTNHRSRTQRKLCVKLPIAQKFFEAIASKKQQVFQVNEEVLNDFNVSYIYTISYLDATIWD